MQKNLGSSVLLFKTLIFLAAMQVIQNYIGQFFGLSEAIFEIS